MQVCFIKKLIKKNTSKQHAYMYTVHKNKSGIMSTTGGDGPKDDFLVTVAADTETETNAQTTKKLSRDSCDVMLTASI